MQHITMTDEQTAIYDAGDAASVELMRTLNAQAQQIADANGCTVEIYTADGIVANVREPA